RHLLDLALQDGLQVKAILSPEHGFAGKLDEHVSSGVHEPTGLPIHSLYGQHQRPTPEILEGLDALVYDIADIGVRFYTYTTTMTHCLGAATEAGLPFFLLDRPNPVRGDVAEGPILDAPQSRLSAWHALPLRHGFTSGELAMWADAEYAYGADLRVVRCEGWRRDMWFHETGLPWVNPSPNIRNPRQALLYVAIGALEACHISVGRGTDTPFEVIGAPWMDDLQAANALNEAGISALSFSPIAFTPYEREFVGEECRGVFIDLHDWDAFEPVRAALQIAEALQRLWPEAFGAEKMRHLLGSAAATEAVVQLRPVEEIIEGWQGELAAFQAGARQYRLYE
ncbi:MAG: DUF1343 domain-containing protein, partial [Armatimonadetes bacterium]|nr:DUF1343 domain-containing protein [Armatimonadota bacterium]